MNPNFIISAAACLCLAGSCSPPNSAPDATPSHGSDPADLQPLPVGPYAGGVQARPSYENARQLSDQVKVGMPQPIIEGMFGPPDKAGYQIYGKATPNPWRALVWEWVFDDVNPPRALSIVFQEDPQGAWRVRIGDWPE